MIGAVAVAIIGAIQSARLAAHERPIKKKEVDAVTLTSVAGVEGVYGELFDNLQKEVARQGSRIDHLTSRVVTLETENERVNARNRVLDRYIDDLHDRWPFHRTRDTPPPRPKPS